MNFRTTAMVHLNNRRQALAARLATQNRSIFIKCTLLTALCLGLATIVPSSCGSTATQPASRRLAEMTEQEFKLQEKGITFGWFISKPKKRDDKKDLSNREGTFSTNHRYLYIKNGKMFCQKATKAKKVKDTKASGDAITIEDVKESEWEGLTFTFKCGGKWYRYFFKSEANKTAFIHATGIEMTSSNSEETPNDTLEQYTSPQLGQKSIPCRDITHNNFISEVKKITRRNRRRKPATEQIRFKAVRNEDVLAEYTAKKGQLWAGRTENKYLAVTSVKPQAGGLVVKGKEYKKDSEGKFKQTEETVWSLTSLGVKGLTKLVGKESPWENTPIIYMDDISKLLKA